MLELMKQELKRGKWVYLGETISFALFFAFLSFGAYYPSLQSSAIVGIGLFVWMALNLIVITLYAVYDFVKIVRKEQLLSKQMLLGIVLKIAFFSFFFLANSMAIAPGNNLPITITTLVATYWIVFGARNMLEDKRLLVLLGFLWFIALFFIFGYGHDILISIFAIFSGSLEGAEFVVGAIYLVFSVMSIRKMLVKITQP
jgi:hypothetical protein